VKEEIEKVIAAADGNRDCDVTVYILRSILLLSYNPVKIRLLGSLSLFRACINLMTRVKVQDKTSVSLSITYILYALELDDCLAL
jgi:hypothetical protein